MFQKILSRKIGNFAELIFHRLEAFRVRMNPNVCISDALPDVLKLPALFVTANIADSASYRVHCFLVLRLGPRRFRRRGLALYWRRGGFSSGFDDFPASGCAVVAPGDVLEDLGVGEPSDSFWAETVFGCKELKYGSPKVLKAASISFWRIGRRRKFFISS